MTYILVLYSLWTAVKSTTMTFPTQDALVAFMNDPANIAFYQMEKSAAYSATAIPLKISYKNQVTQTSVVDKVTVGK